MNCLCPNHIQFSKHVCPCRERIALLEKVAVEAEKAQSDSHCKLTVGLDEALAALRGKSKT